MKPIFRDAAGECLAPQGSVVCIGAFDGMHLGHLALLKDAAERAKRRGLPLIALSFEPLPREFFARTGPLPRLSKPSNKIANLLKNGADSVGLLRFNTAMSETSAEQFIETVLLARLAAKHIFVGQHFRFGHGRRGDLSMLQECGLANGFEVSPLASIMIDAEPVASTRVRTALSNGELANAERLLGRAFSMFGRVVRGAQLGRTLGFPTANMRIWKHPPLKGIFAVRIKGINSVPMHAVSCVGTRPTVNGREWLLETFVFDFDGDLYGKRLEVEFVEKLRDELKFDSLDALKIQMQIDAEQARAVLKKKFSDKV